MQTHLADHLRDTRDGQEASAIVGHCVHCGFCLATCPTFRLLGDELDSPRGRIYLIKQVLEGVEPTARTQLHLDRCLTCRACETTCPSGVEYGRLLDIGRTLVRERVVRPASVRAMRAALQAGLTSRFFAPALRFGRAMRRVLPKRLRAHVPAAELPRQWPRHSHARRMLLLAGCVQPALRPNIDAATAHLLDTIEIAVDVAPGAGCCGAIRHHLDDPHGALDQVRRNIDLWWPLLEGGAEAIVINASGCGAMIKEYGHLLRDDPRYAAKAQRVAQAARDVAEVLRDHLPELEKRTASRPRARVSFHSPCTLQHGQQLRGVVEALLARCGADVVPTAERELCCGSAGTYSILQPRLATQLRDRKLEALTRATPDVILSANIGCIVHLASGTEIRVEHWIEWLSARL
jgi:glycolate oxidase iron-sulfur subunit